MKWHTADSKILLNFVVCYASCILPRHFASFEVKKILRNIRIELEIELEKN